jgi:hypothetical protein
VGLRYATARAATIRPDLINVLGRLAHRARRVVLHLPNHWPRQQRWQALFTAVRSPLRPA